MTFKPLVFVEEAEGVYVANTPIAEYEIQVEDGVFYVTCVSLDREHNCVFALKDMENAVFALNDKNKNDLKYVIGALAKTKLVFQETECYVIAEGFLTTFWTEKKPDGFSLCVESILTNEEIVSTGIKTLSECTDLIKEKYEKMKKDFHDEVMKLTITFDGAVIHE